VKLIYDEDQVRRFLKILKPLEFDEVYFVSMSARNKYLSLDERLEYNLGRSEMMGRKIIKSNSPDEYLRVLHSYEHPWYGKSYVELPPKCLMCYANINASSGKKALKEFYSKTNEILFSLDTNPESFENLRYLDTELMNCYQRARSVKTWIDIDFDSPDREFSLRQVHEFKEYLTGNSIFFLIIETHSGFHVLLLKDSIKSDFFHKVSTLDYEAKRVFPNRAEVLKNSNDMVPIPGTLQGGFEVKFL
jgi:hypothetical protein